MTRRLRLQADGFDPSDLAPAVRWLQNGGVVAFPTDTFYGLAVDPTSAAAVDALFAVKGRPADAALPLIAGSMGQIEQAVGRLDGATARLARAFWPGPLSLLVDAPSTIAPAVHAGTGSLAIRVPAHAIAAAFAAACGAPITATSANVSGHPAVAGAADLDAVAGDARVFVIDGGETPGGSPSTMVDARVTPPRLVRAGAIAWERVLRSLQE